MNAYGGDLRGLVSRAQLEAKRRQQTPSTAHLLLVMLQGSDETSRTLSECGVQEGELLRNLKSADPEAASKLARAEERARSIARSMGAEENVRPAHLLLAIARDPRSAARRSLDKLGADANRVHESLMDLLGVDSSSRLKNQRKTPPSTPTAKRPRSSTFNNIPQRIQARRQPIPPRGGSRKTPAEATQPKVDPPAVGKRAGAPKKAALRTMPSRTTPPANRQVDPTPPPPKLNEKRATAFDLDPDLCPLLTRLGRNLTADAATGLIDPVIGRAAEIEQLLDVVSRRRSNNPILVGPPGVGKTAIVEGLALRLVEGGEGVRGLEGKILVELSAGGMISGTGVRGALSDRIRALREEVRATEGRVILFIDEIHSVVGGDGPDDLGHELKTALARGELPCVGATTDAEYRKHFEKDAALARRFSPIQVDEPTPSDALAILRGAAPQYERHHSVEVAEEALEAAVELSVRYLPERKLPDKAIGVIDMAAARVRRRGGADVDVADVAGVIAERARIPVDRLLLRDADRLLALEKHLGEKVVGHELALGRIADSLRKGAAGFRGSRPLGTFLFLGPTGVGKTETAKAIGEVFFPGSPMTRIDMSEMSEAHAVARLLGAPPGYIGHDDGGQLTEPLRRRPYQLVLLDEIEKAHPEVLLTLLPLLDEGRLTDGRGRTVDFKNTIIVMTSNLGVSAPVEKTTRIGFGSDSSSPAPSSDAERTLAAARRALPPELWNRIDEPLHFGGLSREEVGVIARRLLGKLGKQLEAEKRISLLVDPSAIESLVELGGYDPDLGARPMRRTIGRLIEAPLASAILGGEFVAGDVIRLAGSAERVRFERIGDSVEAAE